MIKRKTDKNKLRLWQERLKANETAYNSELARMTQRETL